MEDFFANLPTGKEDKPLLFGMGPLTYDFHDVDGLYYMLDHSLSGCILMMWAKQMDPAIKGTITIEGNPVKHYTLRSMDEMQGMWILGVRVRGLITEYGKEYAMHVEGFTDVDGNEMNPQDFTITCAEKVEPLAEFEEHEAIARQAAVEGIVLLENKNHTLPLQSGMTLNLFGKGIHQFRNGAVGAGKITPRYSRDFKEAIRESKEYTLNEELVEFYGCDEDLIPSQEILDRAKSESNIAIMLLSRASGENMDNSSAKGEYYLSDEEDALLKKLTEIFEKTIVILNVGYPIDVTWAKKYKVDAVLYSGFGGMLAGPAILDIISGKENPSGKLTDTWALDYFDIPSSRNFYDCVDKPRLNAECPLYVDTYYEEDMYVGYRYFTTFNKKAAYPFGYGLSYTQFMMETEKIAFNQNGITMTVHVKNMGTVPGKDVVQVYVKKPESEIEKCAKELVAFEKTKLLMPKEEETLEISIPKRHLTSYDESSAAYVLEVGTYEVFVGESVEALYCGEVYVAQKEVIKQVTNLMRLSEPMKTLSKKSEKNTYPCGEKSGVCEGKNTFEPYAPRKFYQAHFAGKKPEKKLTFEDVKKNPDKADDFVAQFTVEELARLSVCASAGWGMEGVGEAGKLFKIDGYEFSDFPVSDGNSGVNLRIANIGMPSGVTIASSFNKELSEAVGRVIGEEAKKLNMPMILAPALNIHRNPLNGRQPEYFSEDPYQAGIMAGYYTKGLEGAGVASSMKHLLGNNCETTRKRNQSVITERAIREIYFKAFELAMEIQMPASFMTAYNAVNGCPTAADAEMIQGLLREENGFDGFVMTDWTSYDTADVAAMIEAGNCWMTPGSLDDTYTKPIVDGVESGKIQLGRLQENVSYMVKTMAKYT